MSPIPRPVVDQEQSDESESGVGSESNPSSDGDDEQHRLVWCRTLMNVKRDI